MFNSFQKNKIDVSLLDHASGGLELGITISNAHLAKGLEFDQVLVPHIDANKYANEPDRQKLYVACTRAMHELTLPYSKHLTSFLMNSALVLAHYYNQRPFRLYAKRPLI